MKGYCVPASNRPKTDLVFLKGGHLTLSTVLPNAYYSTEGIRVWRLLFALTVCITSMCELCMHHAEVANANYDDLFGMQQDDAAVVPYLPRKSGTKAHVVLILRITIFYPSHWLLYLLHSPIPFFPPN